MLVWLEARRAFVVCDARCSEQRCCGARRSLELHGRACSRVTHGTCFSHCSSTMLQQQQRNKQRKRGRWLQLPQFTCPICN